jgi:hypothetical protein
MRKSRVVRQVPDLPVPRGGGVSWPAFTAARTVCMNSAPLQEAN